MNTNTIEDVTEGQISQISVTELSTSLQEMVASMAQISKGLAGLSRFIKLYALVQSSILVGILTIIIYFKLF